MRGQAIAMSVMHNVGILPESAYQGENGEYWHSYYQGAQLDVQRKCAGWRER